MKKIILLLAFMFSLNAFASDKLHVSALEDFNSLNPKESFKVALLEDGNIDGIFLHKGDILNCALLKIKDATRAKRDAKAYFHIISYENSNGIEHFPQDYTAKYAKTIMNKEKIKNIPPKKVVKTAAGITGGFFVEGFSYAVSFLDGIITNEEGNRLKSGIKQTYDDSFLSYIEYGEEIDIKTGDIFYFVINPTKERDLKLLEENKEVKGELIEN